MKVAELKQFGENVRRRRLQLGLSQEELAEICGLHRTYIGGVERGERNISLTNISRLAATFEITISELTAEIND